jgi:ring-1,2-phenylacetyl-CoA epoxidase subunit PaaB
MIDQWPRYEVFKQERAGGPFRNVGSVHAPDAELALMNARDVFARRPACTGLWIVPAESILSRTAEEQTHDGLEPDAALAERVTYAVFCKQSQRQTMTYVDYMGTAEARSAAEAILLASEAFQVEGIVWWACPEAVIMRSDTTDVADFTAATSKLFRMPNQYHTVFTMQQIRRAEDGE